jgi:GH25 family lysozyme M1 (1,4-beta-N-acetylmuramidase)/GH24 family phage-related lysozyme (muramidase)
MRKRLFAMLMLSVLMASLATPALAAPEDSSFALSEAGFEFIRSYETLHSEPFEAGGKWYVGYGTACNQGDYPSGITEVEAETLLYAALQVSVNSVNQYISKHALSLEQHQFDALVSFTYALGTGWMSSSRLSTCIKTGLRHCQPIEIVSAVGIWCHANAEIVDQYLSRRMDEAALLYYGDYSGERTSEFATLRLSPQGGKVVSDVAFYTAGEPYGTLPAVTMDRYTFDGWHDANGVRLTPEMLATDQTVTARWSASSALSFQDVSVGDWFYTYVHDLYQSGVINGFSPTSFLPKGTVTRGQALKLILLASNHGEKAPTASHWASGYLNYAVAQGFTTLSDTKKLDEPITRLEIAQIAAKALKLPASTISSPFRDTKDSAVLALYEEKIVEGSYDGTGALVFEPNASITRAEISAIIWRIDQMEPPAQEQPKPEPVPEPTPEDHTGQIEFRGSWIDILPNVPVNKYNQLKFYKSANRTLYNAAGYRCETGVDVSVYQGTINWEKVKADGIDFAIIRVGGRGYGSEGKIYEDRLFRQNIEGALAAGIPVGVYFFSQAITVEEAREEARYTLDQIQGYDITYPVVFDWEIIGGNTARTYGLSTDTLTSAATAFCEMVEDAGYQPMVYFNSQCGYTKYDLSKLISYPFWFAQYPTTNYPNFYYHFDMWQYTDSGTVDGIPGRVDLNLYLIKK